MFFFQLLVGIYGGYFGAGIGILMLSSLAFVGIPDIHQMNAVKSILAATMNGVSAIILGAAGAVRWDYAVIMAIAAIAGGYAGSPHRTPHASRLRSGHRGRDRLYRCDLFVDVEEVVQSSLARPFASQTISPSRNVISHTNFCRAG